MQKNRKLRVMVLTDKIPFPLTQGVNLRIYNFIKYLKDRCDFDLIYHTPEHVPQELHMLFNKIDQLPKAPDSNKNNRNRSFFQFISYKALTDENSNAMDFLQGKISNYDVVLSTTHLLPFLDFPRSTPVVVDIIDDAVLQKWRELAIMSSFGEKIRHTYYMFLHLLYERHYCSNQYIDAAFITSEVDARTFQKVSNLSQVKVIQNGVDAEFFSPTDDKEDNDLMVFEGNMTFDQNVVAAVYFCEKVLPIILKKRPSARLTLVGRDPVPEVEALASHPAVTVTGTVDDIRPYIGRAAVFVCPLLSGGGIKNKILQAWSMGKACVATSLSVGGLEVEDEGNILIRDDTRSFADAVMALLERPDQRAKLGRKGRRCIENSYTWQKKSEELYQLLKVQVDQRDLSV